MEVIFAILAGLYVAFVGIVTALCAANRIEEDAWPF